MAELPLLCLACGRAWRVITLWPTMARKCPYCASEQVKRVPS